MATTRYTLQLQSTKGGDFTTVDFTRSSKSIVVAEAEKRSAEHKLAARVVTGSGTVVHEIERPAQRAAGKRTKPFTKVVDLPEVMQAGVPEGYAAAYVRPRNGAAVLRAESSEAEAEQRYLVINAKGKRVGFAPTTRAAGALMAGVKAKADAATQAKLERAAAKAAEAEAATVSA